MFDLEKAIKSWRKALNKNEALEDGYKEELESHLRDKIDHLIGRGLSEQKAFEDAVKKMKIQSRRNVTRLCPRPCYMP